MARRKSPPDPRGGHVRIYWDLLDSNAWRCLAATDQRCYIALARQLRSTNNGDLSLPLSYARTHGVKSQTTLAKSLRALVTVGLIAVTRKGGSTLGGQRLPTLYRLTDREVYEVPAKHIYACRATNEWKEIKTLAQGRAAIREAEESAANLQATKKNLVQNLTATPSKNGVVKALTPSKHGPWKPSPHQKMDHGNPAKTNRDPNNDAASGVCDEKPEPVSHTPESGHLCITTNGYSDSEGHDAHDESLSAIEYFQTRICGRLTVPARELNPLGRTRNISLFKAAFGYLIPHGTGCCAPSGKFSLFRGQGV